MSRHGRTKDEQFIICLYEEALKTGDLDFEFDRYAIGALISLHPTAVETICVLLRKTNFIIKKEDNIISISPHGVKLALSLLEE